MTSYECRTAKINSDITTFWVLKKMSLVSTKLYNTAMWNAREVWGKTGKIPSGYDLQKVVLESNYHSYLPAHTYQHTAHQVWNAFKSWFKVRKKDKTSQPPGFRKKENPSTFLYTNDQIKIINENTMLLTLGSKLKEELKYPYKRMKIKFNWNTPLPQNATIQQIEIIPKEGFFELHAKIRLPEPEWKTEGQIIAVDLGEKNPIVSQDEKGNIDIYKGGFILSNMRYWNKETARVQTQVMKKTKKKWSKKLNRMKTKGSRQKKQMIHALTSTFAKKCEERNVKEVVIGDLKGIKKQENGKGRKWNNKPSQNWQGFPIMTLVSQLKYKLSRFAIKLTKQDERGTSKGRCSLCGCEDRSKLHRVHRGMFQCDNCKTTQNADVNGSGNQLSRYLHQIGKTIKGSSGSLALPKVWRWDSQQWVLAV